ncbi:MAG: hypothetical protein IH623_26655 [Verrucomicrobia bacterium]|nr:hypothetical protein [Verrucomicrobiota bacterium]
MKTSFSCLVVVVGFAAWSIHAAPFVVATQGEEENLAVLYDSTDLIQGLIPTELPGDRGWHSANSDPLDQLPAFTDGQGIRATGLTGLLNDYPGMGLPAKLIQYELTAAADITEIRVFTGNNGRDGRVFHTYTVRFSSDGAQTFTEPVYVQSHASGTINNASVNNWRVVLSQLTDTDGPLATAVTHLEFDFYAVDNTQGQMRDPFDDINPFVGFDDGLTAPVASPLIWEIDVLGQLSGGTPVLSVSLGDNVLIVSWAGSAVGAVFQSTTSLSAPDWQDLNPQPSITSDGNHHSAQLPIGVGPEFFRLKF